MAGRGEEAARRFLARPEAERRELVDRVARDVATARAGAALEVDFFSGVAVQFVLEGSETTPCFDVVSHALPRDLNELRVGVPVHAEIPLRVAFELAA